MGGTVTQKLINYGSEADDRLLMPKYLHSKPIISQCEKKWRGEKCFGRAKSDLSPSHHDDLAFFALHASSDLAAKSSELAENRQPGAHEPEINRLELEMGGRRPYD